MIDVSGLHIRCAGSSRGGHRQFTAACPVCHKRSRLRWDWFDKQRWMIDCRHCGAHAELPRGLKTCECPDCTKAIGSNR